MAVRDGDLREDLAFERLLHGGDVARIAGPRIDQRRQAAPDQPRPVAITGDRSRIEGVQRDWIHVPDLRHVPQSLAMSPQFTVPAVLGLAVGLTIATS
jgi:hypothetical protein